MLVSAPALLPSFYAPASNIAPHIIPNSTFSSRRPPLVHASLMRRNSRRPTLLQTLCRREKTQLLCNQANPHSFVKTPGAGYTPKSRRCGISNLRTLCSRPSCNLVNTTVLSSPLFSWSYELLFPQLLLFHNYLRCPGVWGAKSSLWSQIEWRLEKVEARRKEPPDTARATKALVHSSPLRGLAATRGA